jgi:hypothetical protein
VGRGGGFFFQVVFGEECGLPTVHFPLGQWTFRGSFFFKKNLEVGVRVSEQRVPKFLTYRCAKGGGTLYFKNITFYFGEPL